MTDLSWMEESKLGQASELVGPRISPVINDELKEFEEQERKVASLLIGGGAGRKESSSESLNVRQSSTQNRYPTLPPPSYSVVVGQEEIGENKNMSRSTSEEESTEEGRLASQQPHYPISAELGQLFESTLDGFHAEKVEIPAVLKPFLPSYIPAVGEVDSFVKIPRIDGVDNKLGLVVLDEPSSHQSDPFAMETRLRQKGQTGGSAPARGLSRTDKNSHLIDKWIANVRETRKIRPPDRVNYAKPMPDIEQLMQEWSPELDAEIIKSKLPTADLDAPLEEYADLCLALLDIPVYKSRIQAMHVMFSLYAEFKNSQHFRSLAANNLYGEDGAQHEQTNRLELG